MAKQNLLEELINTNELQRYQDIFCEAQRIYIRSYNAKGVCITKLSGNAQDIVSIYNQYGKFELNQKMQVSVNELLYSKEQQDILWKDTEFENLKVAAIPNVINGKKIGIIIMIVLYDHEEFSITHNMIDTQNITSKIKRNETEIAVKSLFSFSEIFVKFIYSKNANIERLKEITEKEDIIKN